MAKYYSFLLLIFLIINVNSLLPPEKREELWNKYLKRISPDAFEKLEDSFKSDYLEATYTYDVNEVNSILSKYGFPQNYSFLEEHNITANVKNQKSCGCCWSHAATSALAYRYKLKGLDLDLSPQDGLYSQNNVFLLLQVMEQLCLNVQLHAKMVLSQKNIIHKMLI